MWYFSDVAIVTKLFYSKQLHVSMASMTMARNRSKLKEVYGLEVPDGLTYQGWEPGGTYTKSLILKNVKLRTQKIKFR